MYEEFFQFNERPFPAAPAVKLYFPARSIEEVRQAVRRVVERAAGPALVIGGPGSGKTLLCHLLAEDFREELESAVLPSGQLATRRALLQAILYALGRPYRGLDEGELRLALIDLLSSPESKGGLLLLVDEAHALPLRLLEELRMITNLVRDGQPRVRLVLAGAPVLEERFANPKLESFSQRLAARGYLERLSRQETADYVARQLRTVGGEAAQIFIGEAFDRLYRATDGVPRLVNQVCDHALMLAFAGGKRQLDGAAIEEAWADLQQLPTPWAERQPATAGTEEGVLEFGSLDEPSGSAAPVASKAAVSVGSIPAREDAVGRIDRDLDRLQAHVDDFDEEFHPHFTSQPEVELIIDTPSNPLTEAFADEEAVVDPYAVLDARSIRAAKTVAPQQPYTAYAAPAVVSISALSDQPVRRAAEDRGLRAPAAELAPPPQSLEYEPPRKPSESVVSRPASSDSRHRLRALVEGDDDDLIVVEADPAEMHVPPRPTVKKLEYRKLFAQLRGR